MDKALPSTQAKFKVLVFQVDRNHLAMKMEGSRRLKFSDLFETLKRDKIVNVDGSNKSTDTSKRSKLHGEKGVACVKRQDNSGALCSQIMSNATALDYDVAGRRSTRLTEKSAEKQKEAKAHDLKIISQHQMECTSDDDISDSVSNPFSDDYVPDSDITDSNTDHEPEPDLQQEQTSSREVESTPVPAALEINESNNLPINHCDARIIMMSKTTSKDQCCYFCGKSVKKIGRHLISVHINEPEVAKISILAPKDPTRRKELDRLRNLGDYKSNINTFSNGKGTIIPVRRSSVQLSHKLYLPCPSCFGMFRKENLWRHKKHCCLHNAKTGKTMIQAKAATLIPNPLTTDDLNNHVLSRMRLDDIGQTVRSDKLILLFGSRLLHKHRADEHLHIYVSTKMRKIGRLLIKLQCHVSGKDLMHFLKPSYFPLLIQSVLNVTKLEKGKEAVPSLALKLGHSLKKCGQLLRSQHLMADDFEAAKQSETFISLIESDWAELVSHHALQQLKRRKDNQPALLPLTEDIKVLMKYIDTETSRLLNAMNNSLCQGIWKDLAELLLCQVILFNRRRAGEVERLQTTSCKHLLEGKNYPSQSTLDTELTKSLSPFEMKLIDRMARIETRGKRGRGVAIILTPSMKQTLTTLLNTRDSAGILPTNTHVFACPPSSNLNGYRSVQKVVKMCPGLKQPENITSTKLRKHNESSYEPT